MKVFHFGDLHLWQRRMVWDECYRPKRWMGPANLWLRRAKRFPAGYRNLVIDAALASNADLVVFSGDFTTLSTRAEFEEAATRFAPLVERFGERFFAIPGNHDVYTPESVRKGWIEQFLPYAHTPGTKRLDLPDAVSVLGVNHSEPLWFRSNGVVRDQTHQAMCAALDALQAEGRRTLLVGHFPVCCPPEHPETWEHKLLGEERMLEALTRFRPLAYLHGHKHVRWAQQLPGGTTWCINCGSAGMNSANPLKQTGYVSFELEADGIRDLQAHHWNGREFECRELRSGQQPDTIGAQTAAS